jgi:hypothetical protein
MKRFGPLASLSQRYGLAWIVSLTLLVVTRIFAIARSPWEWDEILFLMAMDDYDVQSHRPHPPGYPGFIAVARLVRWGIRDDFRSLQAVVFAGSVVAPVALFSFLRRLDISSHVAWTSALLLSLTPAFWFHGGTAYSDVPALALALVACWLLVGEGRYALMAGALCCVAVLAFRPQLLLVVLPCLMVGSFRRRPRDILLALGVLLAGSAVVYLAAGLVSGDLAEVAKSFANQAHWLWSVDSAASPTRPHLEELLRGFLLDSFSSADLGVVLWVLAGIGLVGGMRYQPRATRILIFSLIPTLVFSILFLDYAASQRYSLSYLPFMIALVTLGLERTATLFLGTDARKRTTVAAGSAIAVLFMVRTAPALQLVRQEVAPPVAAVLYARESVVQTGGSIGLDPQLRPFGELYLTDVPFVTAAAADPKLPRYHVAVGDPFISSGRTFAWRNRVLRRVARDRYSSVYVDRPSLAPSLAEGWYAMERSGGSRWHWMSSRAVIKVPATEQQRCLTLTFAPPSPPMNQMTVEIQTATGRIRRAVDDRRPTTFSLALPGCSQCAERSLLFVASEGFRPSNRDGEDTRWLSLRLTGMQYQPCE